MVADSSSFGTSIRSLLLSGHPSLVDTLSPQMHEMERKEQQHMLKHLIRLTLPLAVLVLIALYLVLSPVFATYAAAPHAPAQHVASYYYKIVPCVFWRP